jgi:hypothetical protein
MLIKHGDAKPITVITSDKEIEMAEELAKKAKSTQAEEAKNKESN